MSNIIDSIQVSGVTYDLVGSGSITSGEVQTMIDESVSGKVNTVDNQVPAVIKTDCTRKNVPAVSQRYCTITLPDEGTYTYDDGIDTVRVVWYSEDDIRFKAKVKSGTIIQVINSANTVVETVEPLNIDATSVTGNYFTTEAIDSPGDKGVKYECNEGYAFKSLNLELEGNQYNLYNCWVTACSNETIVPSYQSRYAIENYIYPKLDEIESSITQATSGKVDTSTYTAYTAATDTALAGKQTTLTAGTGINITDNVISATGGGGGNPTVEVTQAQYDALVTAGTVSADTYYIITDAQAGDLTNYYTKSETNTLLGGKADTATTYTKTEVDNAITAATSTKQDTLVSGTNIKTINNTSILGSGNIDIQGGGGGGKAVSGGTNISITTGETADIINCTLPFSYEGDNLKTTVSGNSFVNYFHYGQIFGINNTLQGKNGATGRIEKNTTIIGYSNQSLRMDNSIVIGSSNNLGSTYGINNNNYVFGFSNTVNPASTQDNVANNNFVIGNNNTISQKNNNFIFGYGIKPSNNDEFSLGKYNNSVSGSTTFGDSGNTLFSVGNGTADNARHNAFEIRQNGDIYLTKDGQDVKLQDQLGGGSITVDTALDSGSTNPVENRVIYNKIDEVEQVTAAALNNINDRLSEDEEVTAAGLNAVNDKFGGLKLVKLTQTQYDNLSTKDASTLYIIVN